MKILAVLALLPVAIGPLPQEERALTIDLCLGGQVTIPLGDENKGEDRICHSQGCHAGNCRAKVIRKAVGKN